MPTAPLATPAAVLVFLLIGCKLHLNLMHLKLMLRHRLRWTGVEWGGVGWGMLVFVEVDAMPLSLLDRRICKQVLHHVKSFMWIYNNGVNLWTRVGRCGQKKLPEKKQTELDKTL